jgi:hypothetical protein
MCCTRRSTSPAGFIAATRVRGRSNSLGCQLAPSKCTWLTRSHAMASMACPRAVATRMQRAARRSENRSARPNGDRREGGSEPIRDDMEMPHRRDGSADPPERAARTKGTHRDSWGGTTWPRVLGAVVRRAAAEAIRSCRAQGRASTSAFWAKSVPRLPGTIPVGTGRATWWPAARGLRVLRPRGHLFCGPPELHSGIALGRVGYRPHDRCQTGTATVCYGLWMSSHDMCSPRRATTRVISCHHKLGVAAGSSSKKTLAASQS